MHSINASSHFLEARICSPADFFLFLPACILVPCEESRLVLPRNRLNENFPLPVSLRARKVDVSIDDTSGAIPCGNTCRWMYGRENTGGAFEPL